MFDNLQGDNTTREVHGFLTMSVSGIIVMTGGGGGTSVDDVQQKTIVVWQQIHNKGIN